MEVLTSLIASSRVKIAYRTNGDSLKLIIAVSAKPSSTLIFKVIFVFIEL